MPSKSTLLFQCALSHEQVLIRRSLLCTIHKLHHPPCPPQFVFAHIAQPLLLQTQMAAKRPLQTEKFHFPSARFWRRFQKAEPFQKRASNQQSLLSNLAKSGGEQQTHDIVAGPTLPFRQQLLCGQRQRPLPVIPPTERCLQSRQRWWHSNVVEVRECCKQSYKAIWCCCLWLMNRFCVLRQCQVLIGFCAFLMGQK